jgi:primosomal protein N' (replication factor Y)
LVKTVSVAFPVPLRKNFSYSVPEELQETARRGSRARAPFGGRLLAGVIVEEDPPVPEALPLRPLAEVLDEEPALDQELLGATQALAERFFSPWGELLRAALPSSLPAPEAARFEITAAGAAALSLAGEPERRILEALLGQGKLRASEIPGPRREVHRALQEMESRRWVRTAAGRTPRSRGTVTTVAAIPLDEAAARRAAGSSRRAREALAWLADLGRPATAEEMRHRGFSAAVLRRLAGVGAVSVSEQERQGEPAVFEIGGDAGADLELSPAQKDALAVLAGAIQERRFVPALLYGVTGSGKTEVYLRAIACALESGRGAVWLVPEIALTPVFARSLARRFGPKAVVLHSALAERERATAWKAMKGGRARVVIGPRSAVFSPIPDIGLFVVDEEHDGSYKQEESPRYDARDAAALRARAQSAALVLGSATPSLETFHAAEEGRIRLLALPERIEKRPLPEVFLVDLRKEEARPDEKGIPLFSRSLRERLAEVFGRGEQAILLVPRRGYAPYLLCRDCGNDFRCDACSVARAVHRRRHSMICHYCGSVRAKPSRCDRCGGCLLETIGAGTERAAERFAELFPGVRHAILDADTARQRGAAASVIASMEEGRIQALIGTQMVAKGHHFENVTAIGVLSADTLLNFPDFRAAEKTFQLIAQAAGRSGRGSRAGTVHVQTFHPDNSALRCAVEHDATGFARRELVFRRMFLYPPFCEMASLLISSADRERAATLAAEFSRRFEGIGDLRVSGSAPAPLERLKGRWRFQILLRSRSRRTILSALEAVVPETPPAGCQVAAVVDPRNLM